MGRGSRSAADETKDGEMRGGKRRGEEERESRAEQVEGRLGVCADRPPVGICTAVDTERMRSAVVLPSFTPAQADYVYTCVISPTKQSKAVQSKAKSES